MSVYLHDIPLPEAQARLRQALQEADLWRVLEAETIPLDQHALDASRRNRSGRSYHRHIITPLRWMDLPCARCRRMVRYPITKDDFDLICERVWDAAQTHDLVLLNAGSSASAEDFSAQVVEKLGTLLVHGVAVRPGHPVILGMVNRRSPLLCYFEKAMTLKPEQIAGYSQEEYTHLGVAAAIASGRADCGLGIAAAAQALDLDFIPLFQERYDLVIPKAVCRR